MGESSNADVLLAGATAAFAVDLLIYPLDTLKTRIQSLDFSTTFRNSESSTTPETSSPRGKPHQPSSTASRPSSVPNSSKPNTNISLAKLLLSRQSPHLQKQRQKLFRGLYQGVGIVILATLPAAGTFFSVYEGSKTVLSSGSGSTHFHLPMPLVHASASALAECMSCVVLTPAEVIKQNAQMIQRSQQAHSGSGTEAGASKTLAPSASTSVRALRQLGEGGALVTGKRLFSGYTALVARNLPFTALQFPIFEHVRSSVWRARSGDRGEKSARAGLLETGVVVAFSAAVAGSFAAFVTTPMDVVKTRLMLTATSDGKDTRSRRSGLAVTREVLREKGVQGFFRGAVLRAGWTAVGSALYLGMYEVAKVWLSKDRRHDDAKL